ncbi:MAG: hypothetical protein JWP61_533 [Friedmanniella sp.]|nr:hypothetical protein [Friedmanniella sp.]
MSVRLDPWARQRSLARTTVGWAVGSLGVGAVLATRRDPWWRSFGQQHLGWGAVDLAIVAVVQTLQRRSMDRLPDPYAPPALGAQERRLHRVLLGNAIADAGYCVVGAVMMAKLRNNPRAAGAGAAIVLQGAFLMVHDGHHALGSRPGARR